eukprot:TRINITY_DN70304_c0_g1_i1.p1 TRINITY_DN70304_c0_g1~~TRINITY_DN70304_c0_g1_i1.p1  ORF type:complete len:324 (-),score=52.97 TRINITY_DN70304_c0_g1_i1:18-869(-)
MVFEGASNGTSAQFSHPLQKTSSRRGCLRSPPRSPSPTTRRSSPSPPPAPRPNKVTGKIVSALRSDSVMLLEALLQQDGFAALAPFCDGPDWQLPLVKACELGCSVEVLRLLIEHGAAPGVSLTSGGLTPLAALAGAASKSLTRPERLPWPVPRACLGQLLAGADWSPWSEEADKLQLGGLPQQHEKEEDRRLSSIRFLLGAGVKASQCDYGGRSVSDWAEASGWLRVAALLRFSREIGTCSMLRAMWCLDRGLPAAGAAPSALLCLPNIPRELICSFLAPTV